MAKAHDVVVLPTPPFPPTNIQRSVFWSMRFWRVGSRTSSASKTVEDMIVENDVQQVSSLWCTCALQVSVVKWWLVSSSAIVSALVTKFWKLRFGGLGSQNAVEMLGRKSA